MKFDFYTMFKKPKKVYISVHDCECLTLASRTIQANSTEDIKEAGLDLLERTKLKAAKVGYENIDEFYWEYDYIGGA